MICFVKFTYPNIYILFAHLPLILKTLISFHHRWLLAIPSQPILLLWVYPSSTSLGVLSCVQCELLCTVPPDMLFPFHLNMVFPNEYHFHSFMDVSYSYVPDTLFDMSSSILDTTCMCVFSSMVHLLVLKENYKN